MATGLDNLIRGKIEKPFLILIFGTDGSGKTTFASQAPNPIFIGNENGTNFIDTTRFKPPSHWDEFTDQLNQVATREHEFKTLVIDSVDWLDGLLHRKICAEYKVRSIELAAGGYGKGYVEALNAWQTVRDKLNYIRDKKGMNIILIAHAENIPFNDPATQSTYDRYQLKIYKKTAAMLREYVDFLLFANFETTTAKDGDKTRAFGDGVRKIYTERRPGFDAKSRLPLPLTLPLSWQDFEKAAVPMTSEQVMTAINAELEDISDESFLSAVKDYVSKNSTDVGKLQNSLNRLRIRKAEIVQVQKSDPLATGL